MSDGRRIGRHEYNQRLEELAAAFAGRYGRVEYGSGLSASGRTIKLRITVHLPGWFVPDEATLVLVEKHEWRAEAWERYAYAYDLHRTPRPSGRFAYHWHDDVFHVHCLDPRESRPDHHYKGFEVDDIFWVADQLYLMFARGIACFGFQPLRGWVEQAAD